MKEEIVIPYFSGILIHIKEVFTTHWQSQLEEKLI